MARRCENYFVLGGFSGAPFSVAELYAKTLIDRVSDKRTDHPPMIDPNIYVEYSDKIFVGRGILNDDGLLSLTDCSGQLRRMCHSHG